MPESIVHPIHPGIYVKKNILPEGMTVKKAAEVIGVGRPALSNFLNGKAMLSQDMATRLAKAFNADKFNLLKKQQEYEVFLHQENEKRIAVRGYAPSFLNITATHIDSWADKIESRSLLPAFLRRLVNTTGSEISYSDFPAHDNSQRKGWDGKVKSENVTPWVPRGVSGWEFGCNNFPTRKANSDYENRTENVSKVERENITFIFVTPRNWKSKENWIREKREKNEWKEVRAYDANDLEQWIELSVSGQVWLAEQFNLDVRDCQSLDSYWISWAGAANPAISKKIFDGAVRSHKKEICEWYQGPADEPLIITASSKDEALAFIACVADSVPELNRFSDQAVVVSGGNAVKRLAAVTTEFIPIAYSESAEKELVINFKNRHTIVVTEKNATGLTRPIVVDLPSHESFRDALTEMGFDDGEREILASQSGKSPTILRRQLATLPAVKKPAWITPYERIQMMIPLVLAGAWKSNQEADKEILRSLANEDYTNIEKNVAELASIDDAPIWSEDKYRGVVSKLDCFHAISDHITEGDLSKFFFVAEYVLSEDDPALDLEKDERWLANLYDKIREHSEAIRKSICDNLIILSLHGNTLFGDRLGIDIEHQVNNLIRKLLKNKNSRAWQSQQDDLPKYAEAAPDEFLDIMEFELKQDKPAFASLFEPVGEGLFSDCDRTGIIWALELLAWDPSRLSRVARIIVQLCRFELEDNWVHKPINSLKDIFLSWKPHTAATIEQRCEVLELLCDDYPDVGWDICMYELKPHPRSTSGTYRPRWRSDASGAGQVVINKEDSEFRSKCRELVLSWPAHSIATLCDLIDCLSNMNSGEREVITNQIKKWRESSPSDEDILKLREHVRIRTMTQRAHRRNKDKGAYANGKKIYDMLEPEQAIHKNQWLFAKQWVEYTPEELEQNDLNHEAREEKISKQRVLALKEVINTNGLKGVVELCLTGEAGFAIGRHLSRDIMNADEIQHFIVQYLLTDASNDSYRIDSCLAGSLHQLDDINLQITLEAIFKQFTNDEFGFDKIIRLFINAPFTRTTWEFLRTQNEQIRETYWKKINPYWNRHTSEDLNYMIKQLLDVHRPLAPFKLMDLEVDLIESTLLIRLLDEAATNTPYEPDGHFPLDRYQIEQAFKSLDNRDDVKRSELSRLEYLYIQLLVPGSEYEIPNLSKDISQSPLLFVTLLALVFERDDGGKDPQEWNLPTKSEELQQAARNAFQALEYANVIPGAQDDGSVDIEHLRSWVIVARNLAKTNGRTEIGDERIGQLLSKSGADADGIWPREEVRQVVEEIASEHIAIGMRVGLYNSRGAEMSAVDNELDRTLAEKYRNFAESVMNKTPFVGRMLLKIAQSYEEDAKRHDTDYRVRRRLGN